MISFSSIHVPVTVDEINDIPQQTDSERFYNDSGPTRCNHIPFIMQNKKGLVS